MNQEHIALLKNAIHTIPNYPSEGIMFRDVTGILDDAEAFKLSMDLLVQKYSKGKSTQRLSVCS